MNRGAVMTMALLAGMTVPGGLFAKGRTLKIEIAKAGSSAAIEVTDPAVEQFSIWAGAGVTINWFPQKEGFIAQWSKIVEERRPGLPRFQVSFYSGCTMDEPQCRSSVPALAYVVSYEYDAELGRGYVYLPGKNDEWYKLNTWSIFRNVEGNWFLATKEWDTFARPLIERALAAQSR